MTPAVARPIAFVVRQVRQALQQTAAVGTVSPYFPAAWVTRLVQMGLIPAVYEWSDRIAARSRRREDDVEDDPDWY